MAVIQRHNNQLLQKMDTIMHTTGRVDHRNMDWKPKRRYILIIINDIATTDINNSHSVLCTCTYTSNVFIFDISAVFSLNFVKKNEEISRVMKENQVHSIY